MKIIKCLSEQIEDELEDAQKYIDLAMRWKAEEPETADLFYELSVEEMGHMEKLHKEVAEIIEEYRNGHGDPPKEMMTLYEYLHDKHMGVATRVKISQGIYKGA